MDIAQLRFKLNDFRAVGSADIIINGITVMAGENGCGKSTISKLLCQTFKVTHDYEKLVGQDLMQELNKVVRGLNGIVEDYSFYFGVSHPAVKNIGHSLPLSWRDLNRSESLMLDFVYRVELLVKAGETENQKIYQEERLKRVLAGVQAFEGRGNSSSDVFTLFNMLRRRIGEMFAGTKKEIMERNTRELGRQLDMEFKDEKLLEKLELFEYDVAIIDKRLQRLMPLRTVDKVIYIDTPVALEASAKGREYWRTLNRLTTSASKRIVPESRNFLEELIAGEILQGDVRYEKDSFSGDRVVYKRKDGRLFDMLECATGIKAFAIIQLLLHNGHLTEKTLLLIDEPEAHLHPQWIVEYARLIVLLNKILGVKFLIASHSPDMVSALKYISEKEGTGDVVNFYAANRRGESFEYDYNFLENDISEIFNSYNISYEKLDRYGNTEPMDL